MLLAGAYDCRRFLLHLVLIQRRPNAERDTELLLVWFNNYVELVRQRGEWWTGHRMTSAG